MSLVSSIGFKFKSKVHSTPIRRCSELTERFFTQNERNTHFTTFEFQKVARKGRTEEDWEKVMSKGKILKPCEYKRR